MSLKLVDSNNNPVEIKDTRASSLPVEEKSECCAQDCEDCECDEKSNDTVNPEDIKCGFVVGLKKDNQITFDVLGDSPNFLELAGLLEYVKIELDNIKNGQFITAQSLLLKQNHYLLQQLQSLVTALTNKKQ